MPRRKSLYRRLLAEETEYACGAGRPLAIPDGVPATVEVGMGSGAYLVARAAREPHRFFVGVEVKEERTYQAVRAARDLGLANARFFSDDVARVDALMPAARFDELVVLFPDPWPADRDERRRLVGPRFLKILSRWLAHDARCLLRTDDAALFAYARESIPAAGWRLTGAASDVPPAEVETKYEALWRKEGIPIHEIRFERPASLPYGDPVVAPPRKAPRA